MKPTRSFLEKEHLKHAIKYNLIVNIVELLDSLIGVLTLGIYRPHWTMPVVGWVVKKEIADRKKVLT